MKLKATFTIDDDKVGVRFADPHDARKTTHWECFTRDEQIAIVAAFNEMGHFFTRFIKDEEADNAE